MCRFERWDVRIGVMFCQRTTLSKNIHKNIKLSVVWSLTLSRNITIIRDNKDGYIMIQSLVDKVLERIIKAGKGSVFTSKDFTDLTTHDTARQILSRLVKEGMIRRLLRGVYEFPAFSRILNAPASPDPDAIAHAIARAYSWTIIPSGETALNMLGLSSQVPARWEYLTDGPTKKYEWAGGTLVLTHRANKETTSLSPKTALVVQALKTLGKDHIDDTVLDVLRARLTPRERSRTIKEARYVTSWVYEIIKRLIAEGENTHA
jgi:hypothetical protein